MEKMQPQETATNAQAPDEHDHRSDTPQGRMTNLREKVPRLVVAAAIFFASTPIVTPESMGNVHNR